MAVCTCNVNAGKPEQGIPGPYRPAKWGHWHRPPSSICSSAHTCAHVQTCISTNPIDKYLLSWKQSPFSLHVYVCLCPDMYTPHGSCGQIPWSWAPQCGCRKWNPGLLEEQQVRTLPDKHPLQHNTWGFVGFFHFFNFWTLTLLKSSDGGRK